jgi:glucose/arabinose dehydrogenase
MKKKLLIAAALFWTSASAAQEKSPAIIVAGLNNPESVAVAFKNRVFVSETGEVGKDGDGRIVEIVAGKSVPFAAGLDDPKGMTAFDKWVYVADKDRVWKIDDTGKPIVFVAAEAFPQRPLFLHDIAVDEKGVLCVSNSGDGHHNVGAIYRIDQKGQVSLLTDAKKHPSWTSPSGLLFDGRSFLLMLDFSTGHLWRVALADGTATKIADGFGGGGGLAWDHFGRLYGTSGKQGKMWAIGRPGRRERLIPATFESAADLCLDPTGRFLLVPDRKAGTVSKVRIGVPGEEVDDSPLALQTEIAFPKLKWTGWEGLHDDGKVRPLRPVFLTHAGDGSNRVFVALQQGPIHVFPNDQSADATKVFLDLTKKAYYTDKENEQGVLGLAFHPRHKTNGEFFVFYTLRAAKPINVVARFRVKKDDPDLADPGSEEEILRIERPYANHDGGTLCFGPDGFLYIALGDGGGGDDVDRVGQKLDTFRAKVLRIDVDRKDSGRSYAIPKDNPFVGRKDARPEIFAYGFRNIWRMAFDKKTGKLWAADVGQNLYEEINIVVKGGNYGWSLREGLHPFNPEGVPDNPRMIDPIWEYHHDVGTSITGGAVYRGKRLPELDGAYIYGDYISNKIWALWYDEANSRVVANRPIADPKQLIFSFGEDETGDVYFVTTSINGQGIHRFARTVK